MYGNYCTNAQIFLRLAIITTILWTLTLNFTARRAVGVCMLILVLLFFLYTLLVELEIIHNFVKDKRLNIR